MSQEIEIEFKNLLTKDEYDMLLKQLPFPEQGDKQINYYFETEDFQLRKHHAALRIREKNNIFQLTLKEPYQDGLLETHDSLTKEEALSWIEGNPIPKEAVTNQLNHLGIRVEALQYYGSLTTIRREYTENDITFVLDYSRYLDVEDYELEIEVLDKETGIQTMEHIINSYGIKRKETPNKIARFFQAID